MTDEMLEDAGEALDWLLICLNMTHEQFCDQCSWKDDFNEKIETIRKALSAQAGAARGYQDRVAIWMAGCFGPEITTDKTERNHRFLEEALELVQSIGCTQSEAQQLVDYVYGRDTGETTQEIGGVMVTLAALCSANRVRMQACGEVELSRVWENIEKIRVKQAAKPRLSPLPQPPTQEDKDE